MNLGWGSYTHPHTHERGNKMAKMVEITNRSIIKELEKLNTRLEKAQARYEKKIAIAKKYGVSEWGYEEWRAWMDTVETQNGWIVNKEDVKKNGAWHDIGRAESDIREIRESIAYEEKRLAKSEQEVAEYHAKIEAMEDMKAKEELYKLEFEQEQKEWAKDGITLEKRYFGTTPNGKRFCIMRNCGFTERSWHCFTLYIDRETVFTSGEFWRAYMVIKNN